jgi:hypothetical protein
MGRNFYSKKNPALIFKQQPTSFLHLVLNVYSIFSTLVKVNVSYLSLHNIDFLDVRLSDDININTVIFHESNIL